MTRESREARQERAIINLLQTLPVDGLERILVAVGVEPEKLPGTTDNRRCDVCGKGYIACRAADPLGDHVYTPVSRVRT